MNGFSAIIYSLFELLELHQVKKHTLVANILVILLNDKMINNNHNLLVMRNKLISSKDNSQDSHNPVFKIAS